MDKSEIYRSIGGRLRVERERLDYLQHEFAAQGMVGRMSQVGYEAGARPPTAEYLARIARLGADVQFIVTGVRSENLYQIDTAESSLLTVEEDQAKYTFSASKDLDCVLMAKVVEVVQSIIQGNAKYAGVNPKNFAKAVSIIYQNKRLAGAHSAPSTDTAMSVLDVLISVGVTE